MSDSGELKATDELFWHIHSFLMIYNHMLKIIYHQELNFLQLQYF